MVRLCSRCRYVGEDELCPLCEGTMLCADDLLERQTTKLTLVRQEVPNEMDGVGDALRLVGPPLLVAAAGSLGVWIAMGTDNPLRVAASVTLSMAGIGIPCWYLQRHRLRRLPRPGSRLLEAVRPPALPAAAARTAGRVQRLEHEVRGPFSGQPAVAAAVLVRARGGLVRARAIVATDFLVVPEGGESILVTGTVWLEAAMPTISTRQKGELRALAERLGLRTELFGADCAEEVLLVEGSRVEVQGAGHREHVAIAGTYRGAEMLVLRGRPSAPLLLTRC